MLPPWVLSGTLTRMRVQAETLPQRWTGSRTWSAARSGGAWTTWTRTTWTQMRETWTGTQALYHRTRTQSSGRPREE